MRPAQHAFAFGRAAHVLILEGEDRLKEEFTVGGPINPATQKPYGSKTEAYAKWAAMQTKPVISDAESADLFAMRSSVRLHREAAAILREGEPELVYRCTMLGQPCQSRFDWIGSDGLCDLKTCDDLDKFEWDFRRYGYAHQLAFYRSMLGYAFGAEPSVSVIAVEKKPPFRVGVWRIDPALLDQAARDNVDAVIRLERCRHLDIWPAAYERVRSLSFALIQGDS